MTNPDWDEFQPMDPIRTTDWTVRQIKPKIDLTIDDSSREIEKALLFGTRYSTEQRLDNSIYKAEPTPADIYKNLINQSEDRAYLVISAILLFASGFLIGFLIAHA